MRRTEQEWFEYGATHGYRVPVTSANLLQRLYGVRHLRAVLAAIKVAEHEEQWAAISLGNNTGYDWWVVEGIFLGLL